MALTIQYLANAPVLKDSLISGSNTWTMTGWTDSRQSNQVNGNNQNGTERPIYAYQTLPTATATLEALNSLQPVPEVLCQYTYAPAASGSYGGNWVLTSITANLAINTVTTYSVNFVAASGSVMY